MKNHINVISLIVVHIKPNIVKGLLLLVLIKYMNILKSTAEIYIYRYFIRIFDIIKYLSYQRIDISDAYYYNYTKLGLIWMGICLLKKH